MSDTDVKVARAPQQIEEVLCGRDPLCLNILGVEFMVRWGRGVTGDQRGRMRSAWARCATKSSPHLQSLLREPTGSQPFSASVSYQSPSSSVSTFSLQAASFDELAENLTSRLTVAAILANAGQLTMLHACGVADPDTGAVVALVAPSGTGKTTAATVLAGTYGYVTDETVAIRTDGSVVPYPKPLSLKQEYFVPKHQVGPDELGLQPAPAKPFIRSIVLLDRVEGDDRVAPTLSKVPLADALLALIPDSSSQGEVDQPLQSLCRLIDSVGGVWKATYSEAADLPAALAPLFQEQLPSKPQWDAPGVTTGNTPIPDGYIRRTAAKDSVSIDGDLLVMLDSEIVRLSGIGPAIWDTTADAMAEDQLAVGVAKAHGHPEGYQDAVAEAVKQLIAKSVLEQGSN
ncbi:ATP-binding protein [Pseudarthrobacter sp. H3Y2-7]|uniref:ATP-binding protein n=1 Tax=Pseudarthrobacter naphthalenicus TaxID=3031328 RepID=UPI0023AE723C|nr:ATP-binding protein [Pseudarthrobacter sp. H3Y2-7]MDE8668134.1 ATP-binding protein [Pseudarthrobacter sp. H3Y2-7]